MSLKQTIFLAFIGLFGFSCLSTQAHAFVSPKRVMIEQNQQAKSFTVFNRTKEPFVYSFEWERRAQLDGGKRVKLKEGETVDGYRPADEYLVFSPRQVIVQPGDSQRVRIFAKRRSNMPEGEYHSHLLVKPEPLEDKKAQNFKQKGFAGTLKVRSFMSIPVFLRVGKTNIDFELGNVGLITKDGVEAVSFSFFNNSTRSFYSRNYLECVTPDGETQEIVLGATRVYVESKQINEIGKVRAGSPPLDSCTNLSLHIGALQDFEYGRKDKIRSVIIR